MTTLTKEILNECLLYLEDGRLMTKIQPRHHFNSDQAWKVSATRKAVQEEAGYVMDNGYRMIRVYYLGECYWILSHRAVWIMHKGDIEDNLHVDHKDRVITNSRISNLRLTLRPGNTQNSKFRSTNTSGVKGVYWYKKANCWKVQLRADKNSTTLDITKQLKKQLWQFKRPDFAYTENLLIRLYLAKLAV